MFLDARGAAGRLRGRRVRRSLRLERSRGACHGSGKLPYSCRQTPPASIVVDDGSLSARRSSSRRSPRMRYWSARSVRDGTPSLRSRPAGGVFLPAVRGDGARRRRLCDAGSSVPRSPVRPHRPRPRLRVECDLLAGGQCRPLRRDPLHGRPSLRLPRRVPGDEPVLRGNPEDAGVARSARCVPPDDPRAGRRLRDGRRKARCAISAQRSTRGRELLSSKAFYELNTGRVTSAQRFVQSMSPVEFASIGLFRRSRRRVFSSGRLPRKPPGTDPALPTSGVGDSDW